MTDDDATRMLPSSSDGEFGAQSFTSQDFDAATPCVGVSSMGLTHFGETRVGVASVVEEDRASRCSTASARPPSERSAPPPERRPGLSSLRAIRVPPWAGAVLGGLIGLSGALFAVSSRKQAKAEAAPSSVVRAVQKGAAQKGETVERGPVVEVSVRVRDETNQPIEGLFVRSGEYRGVSGTDGVASLAIPQGKALDLQAQCPVGTHGPALVRKLSSRMLSVSARWDFDLSCTRAVVEQMLLVEAKGCGEANVFVDGVLAGSTQAGALSLSRNIRAPGSVEVKIEPLEAKCAFDPAKKQIVYDREDTELSFPFVGKRSARRVKTLSSAKKESIRPYRL